MQAEIIEGLRPLAVPIGNLTPLPGNARRGDVEAVQASLKEFGQHRPLVVRRTGTDDEGRGVGVVVAGNHTLEGARRLGWAEVAALFVDEDEKRSLARALADNHTAELGDYDNDALATMLAEVASDAELLAATAYTDADLDELLHRLDGPAEAERGQAEVRQLDPVWGVIVSCENEAQQVDLLRRLTEEGHSVRAMIS